MCVGFWEIYTWEDRAIAISTARNSGGVWDASRVTVRQSIRFNPIKSVVCTTMLNIEGSYSSVSRHVCKVHHKGVCGKFFRDFYEWIFQGRVLMKVGVFNRWGNGFNYIGLRRGSLGEG